MRAEIVRLNEESRKQPQLPDSYYTDLNAAAARYEVRHSMRAANPCTAVHMRLQSFRRHALP